MEEILLFLSMVLILTLGIIYCNKRNLVMAKNIIKTVLTFFLFFYSGIFSKALLLILNKKYTDSIDVYLNTFSNVCLALILLLMYKKELIKEFKKFKNNFSENIDIGFKYWTLGIIVMMVSNILINFFITNTQATNEQAVQNMISQLPILMILNAGLIGPLIEEITFRKSLRKVFSNEWLFIIISSLLFGSLHVIPGIIRGSSLIELFYIITYSALGFSFAYMYHKTDTVFTSYTMHALHNTILVIL